jgi:hypothetical protein
LPLFYKEDPTQAKDQHHHLEIERWIPSRRGKTVTLPEDRLPQDMTALHRCKRRSVS